MTLAKLMACNIRYLIHPPDSRMAHALLLRTVRFISTMIPQASGASALALDTPYDLIFIAWRQPPSRPHLVNGAHAPAQVGLFLLQQELLIGGRRIRGVEEQSARRIVERDELLVQLLVAPPQSRQNRQRFVQVIRSLHVCQIRVATEHRQRYVKRIRDVFLCCPHVGECSQVTHGAR